MTQALRFCRSVHQLLLHRDGQRYCFWGDSLSQKRSNRSIQARPRKALTGMLTPLNAFARTQIIGHNALTAALMIAHAHALSTLAADDEPLQECGPLSWRREALGCIGLTIHCQLRLISFVILPTNVPHMRILHKGKPL